MGPKSNHSYPYERGGRFRQRRRHAGKMTMWKLRQRLAGGTPRTAGSHQELGRGTERFLSRTFPRNVAMMTT